MNKKEQAEMQAIRDLAEMLFALRWTRNAPVERDVAPPDSYTEYSEGWDYNVHSGEVFWGWSSSISHGRSTDYSGGAQNSCWYYSTKEKALSALRYEMEIKAAKSLVKIDRMIKECGENQ